MRDIILSMRIIGLGLAAFGLISLVNLNCTRPGTGDDMKFPPHLFKPADAINYYKRKINAVPDGSLRLEFLRINGETHQAIVIKCIHPMTEVDQVVLDFDKNGIDLFYDGQNAGTPDGTTKPDYLYEYFRENPILIMDGDYLRIRATNLSGVSVNVYVELYGYSYSVGKHPIEEKSLR